ncbi:MAG: adenine phosphoribosyltransferase [Ruminococcaceae bacterium]|nr:adenine phosphoribosyltransferase [Oscillospiraceae bacterium]
MEQKYYHMTIAGCERDLPLCPLNEDLMIAGFVIFGDPELTTACAEELLERVPAYDYMITAESKGIPLVHEMARLAGNQKYFLARKAPKLYMTGVVDVTVKSITTAKEQRLYLDTADAAIMKGKRILLVDDVVSLGDSMRALEHLVLTAGGEIAGRATILAEGDAANRDDLIYLEKLPLFDKNGKEL